MRLQGRVVKKPVATGSKSDRRAVCLETETGDLILRRRGGHPFIDPVLDGLVGKTVSCEGVLTGQTFILSDWQEVANEEI